MYKFVMFYNLVKLITNQKWYGENSLRENALTNGLIIGIVDKIKVILLFIVNLRNNKMKMNKIDLSGENLNLGSNLNINGNDFINKMQFAMKISVLKQKNIISSNIKIRRYFGVPRKKINDDVPLNLKIDVKKHHSLIGIIKLKGNIEYFLITNTSTNIKKAEYIFILSEEKELCLCMRKDVFEKYRLSDLSNKKLYDFRNYVQKLKDNGMDSAKNQSIATDNVPYTYINATGDIIAQEKWPNDGHKKGDVDFSVSMDDALKIIDNEINRRNNINNNNIDNITISVLKDIIKED